MPNKQEFYLILFYYSHKGFAFFLFYVIRFPILSQKFRVSLSKSISIKFSDPQRNLGFLFIPLTMPPKTPKRGSAGSGSKRGGRLSRGTAKSAQNQQQQQSELVEEKTVIEEEIKVEENLVVEEKPVVEEDNPVVEDKAIDMNQIAPEAVEDANSAKSKIFLF